MFKIVFKAGCSLREFNMISDELARIKPTTFQAVQVALRDVTEELVHIGKLKEMIELSVSGDKMSAFVHINLEKDNCRTAAEIRVMVESLLKQIG